MLTGPHRPEGIHLQSRELALFLTGTRAHIRMLSRLRSGIPISHWPNSLVHSSQASSLSRYNPNPHVGVAVALSGQSCLSPFSREEVKRTQPEALRTISLPQLSVLHGDGGKEPARVRQRGETSCLLGGTYPSHPCPLPGVTLLKAKPLGLVPHTLGLGQAPEVQSWSLLTVRWSAHSMCSHPGSNWPHFSAVLGDMDNLSRRTPLL